MVETVGFIGLGALGAPVAANLLDAGYGLRVHTPTRAKADPLLGRGAEWADRPADAAPPGRIVATLLWDDAWWKAWCAARPSWSGWAMACMSP